MDSVSKNCKNDIGIKEMLLEYFPNDFKNDVHIVNIDILEGLISSNDFSEDELKRIFKQDNINDALTEAVCISGFHEEENMTEEEKEEAQKRRKEDEIKDKVVLLFIQEFKDEYTEERLKDWKKHGRYRNYNEAASIFAQNGGWIDVGRLVYGWDSCETIEGNTIPIIGLFHILQGQGEIVVKSRRSKVVLGDASKKLLSTMIEEWLSPKFNPLTSLLRECKTEETKDAILSMWEAREDKVDFPWTEELDRIKGLLRKRHEEKIKYSSIDKKEGYYYAHWYDIIPWTEAQSETDKMVFLYRLGNAFELYEIDTSLDLSYYQDRKTIADSIKYKIKSQKDWEKRMGK